MATKFKILSASGKSKGLKIFRSSAYAEHMQGPMAFMFWQMRWGVGVFVCCFIALGISFIIEHIWRYGWNPATAHWCTLYINNVVSSFGLSIVAELPYWIARTFLRTDISNITPLIPFAVYFILMDKNLISGFNPYSGDEYDPESSLKANKKDIEKMGLSKGFMMVLGYFNSKPLMMNECLSTLCLAPPGTGKTQGVVLPTIFESNTVSMIINDPKPELKQISSGYRSTIGPVFIMNWAGQDDPSRGIYYPSWNPLSPSHIPYIESERELYIDSIAKILVPDPAEQGSSADSHWTDSARMALSGFINFIVSKIERAKANDYFYSRFSSNTFDKEDATVLNDYYISMMERNNNAYAASVMLKSNEMNFDNYVHIGTWKGIPEAWKGKEASLSLILDWLTSVQINAQQTLEEQKKQGDMMMSGSDPIKDILELAINEATEFGYSKRSIQEISKLTSTPEGERGSILSTMITKLGVFKNAAVKNRTSHSDFHFKDLRGIKDPKDGKVKPVTVYLSINMVDAKALNPITAVFIDLMSDYLLANPPNHIRDGEKLGHCPVLFLLDEMPKMQRLDAVIQGPDLGRGQKISYLIIGQDLNQIAEKYGEHASKTIISTTAAKIILRQNSLDTAKEFSEIMGMKIKVKTDDKGNKSKSSEPLYSPESLTSLNKNKQIVIFQGFYKRPIEADHQPAYKDERLKKYMAMGESSPLPDFLIPFHHKAMGYIGNPKVYNPQTKEITELEAL